MRKIGKTDRLVCCHTLHYSTQKLQRMQYEKHLKATEARVPTKEV